MSPYTNQLTYFQNYIGDIYFGFARRRGKSSLLISKITAGNIALSCEQHVVHEQRVDRHWLWGFRLY
jgi:hypothetical protein